jgi:hypothetical protein
MKRIAGSLVAAMVLLTVSAALAQDAPARVIVNDHGVSSSIAGPGAPPQTIGLTRLDHPVDLDTGKMVYGLRYGVCVDPKDPKAAVVGEGYIGMSKPSNANWYHGGFFDLEINGKSIGKVMAHSVTVRSVADRGFADFVFDTPMAVVRIRFVARAGGDCLYAQALLEPKEEIKSVRLLTRCYPSAFVSNADRHVLTPTRDLRQGEKAELDVPNEWWTLYYDSVYDAGYHGATYSGAGPCSMLWYPGQVEQAGFTVGGYGIDTVFTLKPMLRDFRFVFFDYTGTKNADAMANLRSRSGELLKELTTFQFTDPSLANWNLAEKQAEVRKMLALVPEDKADAAKYEEWSKKLTEQLKLIQTSGAGSIMAEAEAARTISEWEAGLPDLKLKALLREI